MIIYFSIYTFLGYLMESCYVSLLNRRWISSGLFKGPFIPLYGVGACLLIILTPLLTHPLLAFFVGGSFMTLLEYITSWYIENLFHTKCWDYSKHRFHFQGRICLLYFLIWCFLSYLFIFYIQPFMVSHIIIHDFTLLLSVIYCTFITKGFIERLQVTHSSSLIQIKNKESDNSLS